MGGRKVKEWRRWKGACGRNTKGGKDRGGWKEEEEGRMGGGGRKAE